MPPVTHDDDPTYAPRDKLGDLEPDIGPLPVDADGGLNPAMLSVAPELPLPAATPDNFVCLRGPCTYYWEFHTRAEVISVGAEGQPMQLNRVCTYIGRVTELEEDCVFFCSRWDPEEPDENREHRREAFYAKHPNVISADKLRLATKKRDQERRDAAADKFAAENAADISEHKKRREALEAAKREAISSNPNPITK